MPPSTPDTVALALAGLAIWQQYQPPTGTTGCEQLWAGFLQDRGLERAGLLGRVS